MYSSCGAAGLLDSTVELSYEECECLFVDPVVQQQHTNLFKPMFHCIDTNGDSYISLSEWIAHNATVNIPLKYD